MSSREGGEGDQSEGGSLLTKKIPFEFRVEAPFPQNITSHLQDVHCSYKLSTLKSESARRILLKCFVSACFSSDEKKFFDDQLANQQTCLKQVLVKN